MTEDTPKQTIFVELDALMDTRAACIASFGEQALTNCITPEYFTRLRDDFKISGYAERYKNRNKEFLKNSIMTPVITMITEFVESTLRNNLNSPHVFRPAVTINTYPYVLTDKESETLVKILVHKTKEEADIQIVHMDYDELTPAFVRNHVSVMVMYHAIDWLEAQADAGRFATRACPDVGMLCPALARGPDTNMEKDPFEVMETVAATIIGLKFIPIESFCMVINPFKKPT